MVMELLNSNIRAVLETCGLALNALLRLVNNTAPFFGFTELCEKGQRTIFIQFCHYATVFCSWTANMGLQSIHSRFPLCHREPQGVKLALADSGIPGFALTKLRENLKKKKGVHLGANVGGLHGSHPYILGGYVLYGHVSWLCCLFLLPPLSNRFSILANLC